MSGVLKGGKKYLSPTLVGRIKSALRLGNYYVGNYSDWNAARRRSSGYDSEEIVERVRSATAKVLSGDAAYERDSVLFAQVQHSYPLLAGLLRAATENENRLSVLDFGGSLGSSYRQCCEFLSVVQLSWAIVEQKQFVACGKRDFETDRLRFFYEIDECVREVNPNVALLSSVLPYLEDPYAVVRSLVNLGIPYIILDRTVFSESENDRISVQHVPSSIYPGSYPIRIFGKNAFRREFAEKYSLLSQFDGTWDGSGPEFCGGLEFISRGMIFRANRGSQ